MNRIFLLMGLLLAGVSVRAQLVPKTKCPEFNVDLLKGLVNGIKCTDGLEYIKGKFPCFTSSEPNGSSADCGAGVAYKDRDLYFYTQRNYVEIGEHFKGKLSMALMGAQRSRLFSTLGNPKLRDDNWDAYSTAYGTMVLFYNKASRVNRIIMTGESPQTLRLCK